MDISKLTYDEKLKGFHETAAALEKGAKFLKDCAQDLATGPGRDLPMAQQHMFKSTVEQMEKLQKELEAFSASL